MESLEFFFILMEWLNSTLLCSLLFEKKKRKKKTYEKDPSKLINFFILVCHFPYLF